MILPSQKGSLQTETKSLKGEKTSQGEPKKEPLGSEAGQEMEIWHQGK